MPSNSLLCLGTESCSQRSIVDPVLHWRITPNGLHPQARCVATRLLPCCSEPLLLVASHKSCSNTRFIRRHPLSKHTVAMLNPSGSSSRRSHHSAVTAAQPWWQLVHSPSLTLSPSLSHSVPLTRCLPRYRTLSLSHSLVVEVPLLSSGVTSLAWSTNSSAGPAGPSSCCCTTRRLSAGALSAGALEGWRAHRASSCCRGYPVLCS